MKGRPVGRPPLPDAERERVNVSVRADLYGRLAQYSKESGRSIRHIIEQAIDDFLKNFVDKPGR